MTVMSKNAKKDLMELGGGNTESSPLSQKKKVFRGLTAKRWNWVLHNWANFDLNHLDQIFRVACSAFCAGYEICPDTGTPHLQGYCEFAATTRPSECKAFADFKQIHWGDKHGKPCRSPVGVCVAYTQKDGKCWKMHKLRPPPRVATKDIIMKVDNGHGPYMISIAEHFDEPEDPMFGRKIYWFWEQHGNWGKSVFLRYLVCQYQALVFSGKAGDMKFAMAKYVLQHGNGPPMVVINIPKSNDLQFVSMIGMEELKDGLFFSGKYEGGMVMYDRPHVLVFANVPPDESSMSADRWVITELPHGCCDIEWELPT